MADDSLLLGHWYGPVAEKPVEDKMSEDNSLVSTLQRMPDIEASIKRLLKYSLDPIFWKWEFLSKKEKEIIPSQEELNRLRAWVESE